MKFLALISFVLSTAAASAMAGGPCYTGVCRPTYSAPVYHAPAVVAAPAYQPPVIHNNVTLIGVPVPIAYDRPLALQGSSHFSYTKVSDILVPLDNALYVDKSERLASQAISLAQQARTGFDDAISQQIQAQKEVAQQLAIGQVAREIVESISKAERQRALLAAGQTGALGLRAVDPTTATGVLQARCVECHQRYNDWGALDRETQLNLIGRIMSPDSGKRMPRAADKQSVGESLTPEELGLLYKELKQ